MPDDLAFMQELTEQDIAASVDWLREALAARNIRLHPESDLAGELRHLEDFKARGVRNETVRFETVDEAVGFAYPAWGADFLAKVLQRGAKGSIVGFDDRLRSVASAKPLPTSAVRVERIAKEDLPPTSMPRGGWLDRNLVWELSLACGVATFASDVALEDPPDIIFTFGGRRVGIAAKVVYSEVPERLEGRIVEGARQLERSPVDEGYVVVNLAERYPAANMFRTLLKAAPLTPSQVTELIDGWAIAFMSTHDVDGMARRMKGCSKLKSIIFFIPALIPARETLIPMYRVSCIGIEGREDAARPFECAFNDAFQGVHAYRPTQGRIS